MWATRFVILPRLALLLAILVLGFASPRSLYAQANLENPASSSFQSGIGIISGWKCTAGTVTITVDNGPPAQAAYGTSRADTQAVCGGKTNTGFGLLFNWNLLGDGQHTLRAFDNGVQFASATFTVTTLGQEFLRGASGSFTVKLYTSPGTKNVTIQWQESLQNFAITRVGSASTSLMPSLYAAAQDATLENPQAGSFQSGIGVISGWKCTAGTVTITVDNGPPAQAAYGTSRADTQAVCGGKTNTGFGLLFNWNLLGDGQHTLRAFDNGVQFAEATFTVTTLGAEFLKNAFGNSALSQFPQVGKHVHVDWQKSLQNFAITELATNLTTAGLYTGVQKVKMGCIIPGVHPSDTCEVRFNIASTLDMLTPSPQVDEILSQHPCPNGASLLFFGKTCTGGKILVVSCGTPPITPDEWHVTALDSKGNGGTIFADCHDDTCKGDVVTEANGCLSITVDDFWTATAVKKTAAMGAETSGTLGEVTGGARSEANKDGAIFIIVPDTPE